MRVKLIYVGKDKEESIISLVDKYQKRIDRYTQFSIQVIDNVKHSKKLSINELKELESKEIEKHLSGKEHLVLLDEKGRSLTSIEFSNKIEHFKMHAVKEVVFLIGGAYGFDRSIYTRANEKIRISDMTLPHQLARVIFLEQLYRALTILNNEKYHH